MTGPGLPLCHGSAIISNDWQQHKLDAVFVVWFTSCFQPVLRYLSLSRMVKKSCSALFNQLFSVKNKTLFHSFFSVIIPFTTPVYFSARCKCILLWPEHQRFMFVVGTAEHQLSFKKRQLKKTHTQLM